MLRMMKTILLLALLSIAVPAHAIDWTAQASCKGGWLFDESSGNAVDECDTLNDGTVTGVTYSATGQFGTAFTFAPNDFVEMDGNELGAGDLTFVHWLKTTSTSGAISFGEANSGGGVNERALVIFQINNASGRMTWFVRDLTNSSALVNDSTGDMNDGTFHHWAGVADEDGNIELFKDGTSVGTAVHPSGSNSFNTTSVGVLRRGSASNFLTGTIDEPAKFNVLLDSTDINDILDNGLKGAPVASGRRIWVVKNEQQKEMSYQ